MMSTDIGRETTTYSPFATKNVSAITPAETTYDWSNTVTWTVSNTVCMISFLKWSGNLETAVHEEIRVVDRNVFCGYVRESWYFWMDKSKWEIYFHNSLGIKWHMQTGGNVVLSGQQKQQNVPAEHVVKVVAAVMDYALWLFQMEFTSRWTSTMMLAITMRFSPHTEERKFTLVQINRRWRKPGMNMIKGGWHLCFFWFPPLEKQSEEVISLAQVSVLWLLVQHHILSLICELFCCRMEKLFLSLITDQRSELSSFSVNSKVFLPWFLPLIASLRAAGVVLSLYQYSQLVLLLHFHDRHAFSCLVAVPAFKIISLAEHYSKVFVVAFKIISVTGRPTSSCFVPGFQVICVAGRFTPSYFQQSTLQLSIQWPDL